MGDKMNKYYLKNGETDLKLFSMILDRLLGTSLHYDISDENPTIDFYNICAGFTMPDKKD
jgi:hypothetical protein